MKILCLGGTGTIGSAIISLLSGDANNDIRVVNRKRSEQVGNVLYVVGDALNENFISRILSDRYDVIIDLLWHDERSIKLLLPSFLSATEQYIFFSSAAVYANHVGKIDESCPRFIDLEDGLGSVPRGGYSRQKALAESVVVSGPAKNWTIVRPHVTFNNNRIPLCTWEMNIWLQRAVLGLPVAIPKDVLPHVTTLSSAALVASQILKLIGNRQALGEVFQVGSEDVYSWRELLNLYSRILSSEGFALRPVYCDSKKIWKQIPFMKDRFENDRLLDRTFSTAKLNVLCGGKCDESEVFEERISSCIRDAIRSMKGKISDDDVWMFAAHDKILHILTPLSFFDRHGALQYVILRFGISQAIGVVKKMIKRILWIARI